MEHVGIVLQIREYLESRGIPPPQSDEALLASSLTDDIGIDSLDLMGLFVYLEEQVGLRYSDEAPTPIFVKDILEHLQVPRGEH